MNMQLSKLADFVQQQFPFEVVKMPLRGPDDLYSPYYGLYRNDTWDHVPNAVMKGYVPHTTEDVCDLATAAADAFGDTGGVGDVSATWRHGHYVKVTGDRDAAVARFREQHPDAGAHQIIHDSDVTVPFLLISAGYDGRAFTGSLGVEVAVCRNALIIPGVSVTRSIQHTSGMRLRIADLVDTFRSILAESDAVEEKVADARERQVHFPAFLREVYPLPEEPSGRQRRSYEKRIEEIIARVQREREMIPSRGNPFDLCYVSAWEAFNAVQGYAQHTQNRRGDPDDLTRAIIASTEPAVKTAAALAFA